MFRVPLHLSFYIGRQFLFYVMIVFLTLMVVILLADALELFRRSSARQIPTYILLQMIFLKFPMMWQKIMPFIILISAILTYRKLSNSSELVVIRSAGISVWEFLAPSVICALLIGIIMVTIINPISTAMVARFERLDAKYFQNKDSYFTISSSGLWLRQSNALYTNSKDRGEIIIKAQDLDRERPLSKHIAFNNVTLFVYGAKDKFFRRLDAKKAVLLEEAGEKGSEGYWHLLDVIVTSPDGSSKKVDEFFLETDLTTKDIQNSFATPETISFWSLPGFINTLKKSGFSAISHRLHWHSILTSPFFYAAMILIAALFSLTPPRQGKGGLLISGGIAVGFFIYFLTNLVMSLGLSGSIPVVLAAWAPSGVTMLIGALLLLHFEDG